MSQFLDIFAFLSLLLRALTLAFEALTVGGVVFRLAVAPQNPDPALRTALSRFLICSSVLLAVAQLGFLIVNAAVLMGSMNLKWTEVIGATFCISGALMISGACLIVLFARARTNWVLGALGCAMILCGSVMTSHSVGRLEHRWPLAVLTFAHHFSSAAWIGGLPYLLLSLRRAPSTEGAARVTRRFSRVAMVSVPVLIGAGATLSLLYVGSVAALTGTAYGIMVLSKIVLTCLVLIFGALNYRIVNAIRAGIRTGFLQLRRFSEAEVGIGVTILLAAASLTSSPPAVDVQSDRVTGAEIAARMTPIWPRMQTPRVSELSPVIPLGDTSLSFPPASFIPGQSSHPNSAADIAWSEYNHHWSGLVVLVMGILSLLSRRIRWARNWPLAFLGLGLFLLIRADSESWPLGPRGFWESFQVAEVAQHRLFVLLIVAFAVFEWRVQTAAVYREVTGLVFPLVCAIGGALLLTHTHSLGNAKEQFLAELSHVPLAILAVAAGWSRWLEVRLRPDKPIVIQRVVPWIWPVCFILIGAILMNYREA